MSNNSGLVVGIALLGIAYLAYSKKGGGLIPGLGGQPMTRPLSGGAGSMPGNVGTGVSQIVGGLIGNMLAPTSGGGTSTGAPVADAVQPLTADQVQQNTVMPDDTLPLPTITYDPFTGGYTGGDD